MPSLRYRGSGPSSSPSPNINPDQNPDPNPNPDPSPDTNPSPNPNPNLNPNPNDPHPKLNDPHPNPNDPSPTPNPNPNQVPCLAATDAPDFARGYGGADGGVDAATWLVGETVHEMVCGAKGTAATYYTSDVLPGDVRLSTDGHLQGSVGAVASTASVVVRATNM